MEEQVRRGRACGSAAPGAAGPWAGAAYSTAAGSEAMQSCGAHAGTGGAGV